MAGREPAPACSSLLPLECSNKKHRICFGSHWPRQQCRIPSQPVALLLAFTPARWCLCFKGFFCQQGQSTGVAVTWGCSEGYLKVLSLEDPVPGLHLLPLWEGLFHPSAAEAAVGIKDGPCSMSRMRIFLVISSF